MCGISGIVTRDGSRPDEGLLRRMSDTIAHRGSDGEAVWSVDGVGFAHRRLAIIDLSARGRQPMTTADGQFTVVFNGEIYNYRELKTELHANWKSDSDTEVILEGYRTWGDDVVKRLRGMFAFALWDATKQRLLCARDPIGKKPFFYTTTAAGDFAFASELKALAPVTKLSVDWNAVRTFLGLQYVPSPMTGFDGVKQLEPGTIGKLEGGMWKVKTYHGWKMEDGASNVEGGMWKVDQKIRELLEGAVTRRMLASDVPVGAFLSGGIDSAAVVAYASKIATRPLQTFTMGFPNLHLDERAEAREIAAHFKTDHQEFEARPEHLIELVDTLVSQYDAPYADSSALPLYLLARETAQEIKVVLTGDGGDELFGGYRRYVAFQHAMTFAKIPLGEMFATIALQPMFDEPKWRRFFETVRALRQSPTRAYGELFCGAYFNSRGVQDLCTSEFLEKTNQSDAVAFVGAGLEPAPRRHPQGVPLRDGMMFDLTSYLPDDLNVKMDRATMAFGLEARAPFLDQELVTYALQLPLNQKIVHGKTKVALKRALTGVVPNAVLHRRKRGFQVPLAQWFREDALNRLFSERCLSSETPLSHVCRPEAVKRLFEENLRGSDHGNRLWMLLSLATWLKRYV